MMYIRQEEPQVENFAYIVVKSDGNFLHRTDEKLVIKLLAGLSDAEEIITERILKIGRYGSCTEVMVIMQDGKLKLVDMKEVVALKEMQKMVGQRLERRDNDDRENQR